VVSNGDVEICQNDTNTIFYKRFSILLFLLACIYILYTRAQNPTKSINNNQPTSHNQTNNPSMTALAYSTLYQTLLVPPRCCDHHTVNCIKLTVVWSVHLAEPQRKESSLSVEVLAAKAELVG
jgi:hypothetical protein